MSERAHWKVEAAAAATRLLDVYEGGALEASDFVGRTGWLRLDIQPATEAYEAQNVVKCYIGAGDAPKPMYALRPAAPVPMAWPGRLHPTGAPRAAGARGALRRAWTLSQ